MKNFHQKSLKMKLTLLLFLSLCPSIDASPQRLLQKRMLTAVEEIENESVGGSQERLHGHYYTDFFTDIQILIAKSGLFLNALQDPMR